MPSPYVPLVGSGTSGSEGGIPPTGCAFTYICEAPGDQTLLVRSGGTYQYIPLALLEGEVPTMRSGAIVGEIPSGSSTTTFVTEYNGGNPALVYDSNGDPVIL